MQLWRSAIATHTHNTRQLISDLFQMCWCLCKQNLAAIRQLYAFDWITKQQIETLNGTN